MQTRNAAEEFFLIVHDSFTGKPWIGPDLLLCGLVAAQLGELTAGGRLAVRDGAITVAGSGSGADHTESLVVESVRRYRSGITVRTCIEAVADALYGLVTRDLAEAGIVQRTRSWGLRRSDRFPAVDLLAATRSRTLLEHMLRNPRAMDEPGGFMAALLWTVGADRALDPELDRTACRKVVEFAVAGLRPELRTILDGTAETVAATLLTVRR